MFLSLLAAGGEETSRDASSETTGSPAAVIQHGPAPPAPACSPGATINGLSVRAAEAVAMSVLAGMGSGQPAGVVMATQSQSTPRWCADAGSQYELEWHAEAGLVQSVWREGPALEPHPRRRYSDPLTAGDHRTQWSALQSSGSETLRHFLFVNMITRRTLSLQGLGSFLVQSWHLENILDWDENNKWKLKFIRLFSFRLQPQSHTLAVMRLFAFQADRWTCIFHLYEMIVMPDSGRRHNVCWCSESTARDWLADFSRWQPGMFYLCLFIYVYSSPCPLVFCVSLLSWCSLNTHEGFVSRVHNKPNDRYTVDPVRVCAWLFTISFNSFGMDVITLFVYVSNPIDCMDYSEEYHCLFVLHHTITVYRSAFLLF